jgi:branched-subunit amino acid aminotransferase/4-amino-4-deoxychorismate lyase
VDDDGYVLEAPTMNLAIVTHTGQFVVPPFEDTLAGITIQRVLQLLPDVSHVSLGSLLEGLPMPEVV